MSDPKVCTGIMPNPDVAGLGIRLGFYITCFFLTIITRSPSTRALTSSLLSNTRVYTSALLLTAIIQTAQGQLTLYHATLILHMLMFFSYTVIPSPSEYYDKNSLRLLIYSAVLMISFSAWSLHIWITASTFGSQPECNHSTKYVLGWHSVLATARSTRLVWATSLGALPNIA
ncbi:hypothetical protein BD410DRAFT_107701 [Rickenella mellea]|uniref:Uncharacterized protein n=1 Tax=Rickenella mellea TaxID=50990 RepID=A0A4Y7PK44_9AGAM|nr:hypothetical protein BD410DRAFT_107701 [Rickenella mellea]